MGYDVGINVVEVDGKVTPSIQPAPTSVAAFIIRSQRGVPETVHRISNWSQFTEHFGSYMDGAYGAYVVRGFFDNGGSVAYVTRVVQNTGQNAAKSASQSFKKDGNAVLTITAGYRGEEDPGAWGNEIAIQITDNEELKDENNNLLTYDLTIKLGDKVVESWEQLNTNYDKENPKGKPVEETINSEFSGSKYVTVSVKVKKNPDPTKNEKGEPDFIKLKGGTEDKLQGATLNTPLKNALSRFNVHQVQLVCCPESDSEIIVSAALTYCQNRGDCMFIGHTPNEQEYGAAKEYGKKFMGNKIYGALYFPWIRVNDPIGEQKWIPPTGHVMGVYARTERERGVWKAPAGNAACVYGALDVQYHITDNDHTDLVKNGSVNAVRYIPGLGIVIDSSRTLSSSPLWLYVNIRLLFNFVKSSLKSGLRWVVQEPNDDTLWNKVKFNSVTPFLMGLWRRRAFGPGTPEEVFTVKCDAENNPPENIQQGIFTVEVYFYPSRPAETIVIIVGQQEGGATASEG